MVNTRKRKQKLAKFAKWRKENGVIYCRECGKRIIDSMHHFLCATCWNHEKEQKIHHFKIKDKHDMEW